MGLNNNNSISIITPSYNRADIIHETAESIFNQTYPHWEWVIVDDGSTDNSWETLQQYSARDSRVKAFRRDRGPKGACTCRNIGVQRCSGTYVMFLDTDDIIEPFCMEKRLLAMQNNPQLDFAIFPSLMFSKQPYDLNLWWNIDKTTPEIVRQFHQDAICQGTGILIKKSSFIKVGMWDESLLIWQDIDLFFRLFIQDFQYKKFFELLPDLHNRTNHPSLSRSNFFTIEKLDSRKRVLINAIRNAKKHGKNYLLPEAKYMLAEIISGLARIKKFKVAFELLQWGKNEGVVTNTEFLKLKIYIVYFRAKIYKLSFLRMVADSIRNQFSVENTLGKLTYRKI